MQATFNHRTIELLQGDITVQEVDAIVNAANTRLAGGGGVDGAIHRAGGPSIMAETGEKYPEGCETGSAVVTGGGDLPARLVIHAVGPVYSGGERDEASLLAGAYRRSLELATENDCRSIALPALSTGAYRYPLAEASRVATTTAADYLNSLTEDLPPKVVRFVLFDRATLATFKESLEALTAPSTSRLE